MNEFRQTVATIMFWFSFDEMLITELIFNAEREVKIKYVILALRLKCDLNAFATAVKFEMLVVFFC